MSQSLALDNDSWYSLGFSFSPSVSTSTETGALAGHGLHGIQCMCSRRRHEMVQHGQMES